MRRVEFSALDDSRILGYFHMFTSMHGNAIVEDDDGNVHVRHAENIEFLDKPESEQEPILGGQKLFDGSEIDYTSSTPIPEFEKPVKPIPSGVRNIRENSDKPDKPKIRYIKEGEQPERPE